jgi:DNA-binding XRE family transcriptional regulator
MGARRVWYMTRSRYRIRYSRGMGEDEWEIYQTDEVAAWMRDLRRTDPQAADKVEAAVDVLAEYGPTTSRSEQGQGRTVVTSFSKWDRDAYRARVGEQEAARRRGAIMAEQWGYQLAEQRKRLGFTQAGLAQIMGVTPGRVSQIEHGEVSTVEALASYIAALGGKLELVADIGGHLLKMPANPAA